MKKRMTETSVAIEIWVGLIILFLISLLFVFPDLADKYIFCRGADEGKQPVSSGCYDKGREYLTEEELK